MVIFSILLPIEISDIHRDVVLTIILKRLLPQRVKFEVLFLIYTGNTIHVYVLGMDYT